MILNYEPCSYVGWAVDDKGTVGPRGAFLVLGWVRRRDVATVEVLWMAARR